MSPAETLASLQRLLDAAQESPFQRRRIGEVGAITTLDAFSKNIPLTSKAELVQDFHTHPPYGSNHTEPLSHYTRFCQTSGTTAQPLAILDTAASWEWMLANWQTIYHEGRVLPGARVYFAFSFGPFLGFWTAFEAAVRHGCLCIPGGGLSSAARLRAMAAHRAEVLCCTPTYALHLADTARREGLTASVEKIIVAGEPGGSVQAVRQRISEAWGGAEVLDHYGMTEVGPVAFQRSGEEGGLHIIEAAYYAEIIDPESLVPVPPGQAGELILTPLGRHAWPLLRYRTGDLVRRSDQTDFHLDGGILGRVDDMLVVRGVNVYPSAVDDVVRSIPSIGEYRVHVTRRGEMTELAMEIESDERHATTALQDALTSAFTLRIPVSLVPRGTLPQFEMKARRWVLQNA